MEIEEFLNRLADLILFDMEKRMCTQECFAELCGLSRSEVLRIIHRKKKDVNVSTVLKIVENSTIKYDDLFSKNYD